MNLDRLCSELEVAERLLSDRDYAFTLSHTFRVQFFDSEGNYLGDKENAMKLVKEVYHLNNCGYSLNLLNKTFYNRKKVLDKPTMKDVEREYLNNRHNYISELKEPLWRDTE